MHSSLILPCALETKYSWLHRSIQQSSLYFGKLARAPSSLPALLSSRLHFATTFALSSSGHKRGGYTWTCQGIFPQGLADKDHSHWLQFLNGMHSLQLFVVEFDTCLVWEFLLLPFDAQTAPNLPSLKGARWRHL